MKLATVVVVYHPDVGSVVSNIGTYLDGSDTLIVYDNSETCHNDWDGVKALRPDVCLFHEGENVGLAEAYNRALAVAQRNGCTHLMTMDQDSAFEHFNTYRQQIEDDTDPSVGIWCCSTNHTLPTRLDGRYLSTATQSGSVFSIPMLEAIGGFQSDLFIGMVDAEISLRALQKGYRITLVEGCNLTHQLGSGRKINVGRHTVEVSDYGALRHYYDSRNRVLLWHKYPKDYDMRGKLHHMVSRLKVMVKIALFEDRKRAKIAAIVRGTWYGLLNKAKPF